MRGRLRSTLQVMTASRSPTPLPEAGAVPSGQDGLSLGGGQQQGPARSSRTQGSSEGRGYSDELPWSRVTPWC